MSLCCLCGCVVSVDVFFSAVSVVGVFVRRLSAPRSAR